MAVPTDTDLDFESGPDGAQQLYQSFEQYWLPAAYVGDVTDKPFGVRVLGRDIVLVRLAGKVRAFYDLCVHRGTALSLGSVEGDYLRCAYHGWVYDCAGKCVEIPSVPGLDPPSKAQLTEYKCAEAAGFIYVCFVDEPRFPLPENPYLDDPAFRVLQEPTFDWRCSAARRMENVMDFAHFPFVHDGILGLKERPAVAEHAIEKTDSEVRVEIWMDEPSGSGKNVSTDPDREFTPAKKNYRLFMPFTGMNIQTFDSVGTYVLIWAFTPVDEKTTRTHTYLMRDFNKDEETDAEIRRAGDLIVGDDKPIVESQRPEELPFDITAELHIRNADKVSIAYRSWLYECAREYLESSVLSPLDAIHEPGAE